MTTPTEETRGLIAKLGEAKEGGRELDALVGVAADGFFVDGEDPWGRPRYCYLDADGATVSPGQGYDMLVRHYTTSVDSILALIEKRLPGWVAALSRDADRSVAELAPKWWKTRRDEDADDVGGVLAEGKTPALALSIALLTALSTTQDAAAADSRPDGEERG